MVYSYPYPRPAVTVDALVFAPGGHEWYMVLIRRGKEPFLGHWALPGGFMRMNETLSQAVLRELWEETGLKLERMETFRIFDALDRDPRDRTISVVFSAFLSEIQPVEGKDDADAADWFPISQLPSLAFDHEMIVNEFQKLYF